MRLAAAFLAALLAAPAAAEDQVAVGSPAPTFSLRTLNPEAGGAWVALGRLVGPDAEDAEARLVVLSFFASWCGPCRQELPFLIQLDRQYRERGLRVVAVDLDQDDAGIAAARALVLEAGVTYPVCSDRFNIVARRYLGSQAPLPSVFLIRRDGAVARIERGYARDASAFLVAAVRRELGLTPEGTAAQPGRGKARPTGPARR